MLAGQSLRRSTVLIFSSLLEIIQGATWHQYLYNLTTKGYECRTIELSNFNFI